MNEQWQRYKSKVDGMNPRERALLLFAAIAVFYLIWDGLLLGPVLKEKKHVIEQVASVRQQISNLQQEENLLLRSLAVDPEAQQKQEIENLNWQLKKLDEKLSELEVGLVPVKELATILQAVLQQSGGLELLSMDTLPVQKLDLSLRQGAGQEAIDPAVSGSVVSEPAISENEAAKHEDNMGPGVFKHAVVLSLKGSYFHVVNYLSALEQLPWRFYWDRMAYEVKNYPLGEVEVRIYTLSIDKGLLGV